MTHEIKKQLFSGVFYTALAKYSGVIISLIISAILARLVSPDDFGIVAVATVIITFFALFTDMGISAAIVQHKNLTEKDISNIFSFTIWLGVALTLVFFAASWPISMYYNNSTLLYLCQLLCINLFFSAVNIVPNALFYKNKEFRFIALRSFSIQIVCGALAITAALCGARLYALIITPILTSILVFIISHRRYPIRASFTLGISSVRVIFSYSLYQFLFNVINYFSRNLDKLLIGKQMGLEPLGFYEKSYRLMMLPLQNITQVITPVMHPIFSDYQNDTTHLAISYEKVIRLLAFIGIPLTALLYFTAHEAILLIFGEQWLASVSVYRILTLSVGVQILSSSSGSIFQASGDTKSLFICGAFSAFFNIAGILLGVFFWGTLDAVAWCIVVSFSINFIQCYLQMYIVTFKRKIIYLLHQLLSPLILGILLTLLLYLITPYIDKFSLLSSLAIKAIISFIVVSVYIQATKELDLIEKIKLLLLKIRR